MFNGLHCHMPSTHDLFNFEFWVCNFKFHLAIAHTKKSRRKRQKRQVGNLMQGPHLGLGYELAPFDLTKKKKKTFVVQDAIEDSAESHGRLTICCLIVQEEFIGYIAEHPNDEEEVEGIDLHQQRYPWEGSDMDYLYDESSFAQLLSMELTLEIDGAIFHVPNANASSNVDSQL
ncbi:hypothetical protein F2Q68_00001154 [Brassica cretica]|uniref:Uncharacterized protein n=1 Tax=Brassica cretica TaxID=69181 RepID=A0A8S9J8V7_BRACR|nr:hypothetical protein F2Q68_00001154 [Brassica cretica]